MTTDNKPREFWIDFKFGPDEFTSQTCLVSMNQCSLLPKLIHVREVLPNEASEIATLRKQLEVAETCLTDVRSEMTRSESQIDFSWCIDQICGAFREINRIGRGE